MTDANSQDLSMANIEGLKASKASMLSEMCKREQCYCLCLQETHIAPHLERPKIIGIAFIAEGPYIKYGSTILIRSNLKVKSVFVWEQDNFELVSIEMPGVVDSQCETSYAFNTARWKRGYYPDLIFVSESIANMCGKSVMEPMSHTPPRPICACANPVVVEYLTLFRRRINLRKADWNGYSTELNKLIKDGGCVEKMSMASRRYIRG